MRHFYQNIIIILFLGACFSRCSNDKKDISIIPINELNYFDTVVDHGKSIITRADFYLVAGYEDNEITSKRIDEFVKKNAEDNITGYTNYNIIFYKQSDKTNIKNIINNPKIIDRHSNQNDKIFDYSWVNGKFLARYKILKGKIVEPKNEVWLEDIKE